MEIFKNKFLVKLIATICLFLALFNFIGESNVYANASVSVGNMEASIGKKSDDDEIWGGVLIKPVIKLLTSLVDAIIEVLQKSINQQETSFLKIEGKLNWWNKWGAKVLGIIVGVAVVVGIIVLVITTGGASLLATALGIGAVVKISAVGIIAGATAGYFIADNLDGTYFPEDIYLPIFTLSVDQIFSNQVALFDINFFNPVNSKEIEVGTKEEIIYWSKKTIFTETINESSADRPDWLKLYEVISEGNFPKLYVNDATGAEFQTESELNSFDWLQYNSTDYDMYNDRTDEAITYIISKINSAQISDKLTEIKLNGSGYYSIHAKAYVVEDHLR